MLQDRARLPPPSDRIQWKHLTNDIARTEMREWTRKQRTRAGRVEAYAQIARELNPHGGVYGQFAQYLLTPGLTRQTRLSIAAMRVQSNAFLATHAGYRETELYGPEQPDYRKRGCICPPCTHGQTRVPDDAAHVLFDCPHFATQRRLQNCASQRNFGVNWLLAGRPANPRPADQLPTRVLAFAQAHTPKSSAKPAPS